MVYIPSKNTSAYIIQPLLGLGLAAIFAKKFTHWFPDSNGKGWALAGVTGWGTALASHKFPMSSDGYEENMGRTARVAFAFSLGSFFISPLISKGLKGRAKIGFGDASVYAFTAHVLSFSYGMAFLCLFEEKRKAFLKDMENNDHYDWTNIPGDFKKDAGFMKRAMKVNNQAYAHIDECLYSHYCVMKEAIVNAPENERKTVAAKMDETLKNNLSFAKNVLLCNGGLLHIFCEDIQHQENLVVGALRSIKFSELSERQQSIALNFMSNDANYIYNGELIWRLPEMVKKDTDFAVKLMDVKHDLFDRLPKGLKADPKVIAAKEAAEKKQNT